MASKNRMAARAKVVEVTAKEKAPSAGKQLGDQKRLSHYTSITHNPGEWVADEGMFNEVAAALRKKVWDGGVKSLVREYEEVYGDQRFRAWTCIAYPESMVPNALQLMEEAGLQVAISPLHDKDKFPDGTPKKPHFHVVFYFSGKKTYRQVKAWCDRLNFTVPQPVDTLPGMCRYLCHMDIDPDHIPGDVGKVKYDPRDVVTVGGFDYQATCKATDTDVAKTISMFEEMCRDQAKYGHPFKSYADFKDHLAAAAPEFLYLACMSQVSAQMSRYIEGAAKMRWMKAQTEAAQRDAQKAFAQVDALGKEVARLQKMIAQILTGEE